MTKLRTGERLIRRVMRRGCGMACVLAAGMLPVAGVAQGPQARSTAESSGTAAVSGATNAAARAAQRSDGATSGATKRVEHALPHATNPERNESAAVKQDRPANPPDAIAGVDPLPPPSGAENLEAVLELMRNRPKPVDSARVPAALASAARDLQRPPVPPGDREQKDQREQLGRALPNPLDHGW